ncbi:carboxylate--amine ligase [Cellulomonas alba]|uniref:ATP-grasp domain-containing protein n=1 Tax=Cellulomonas alba TaxID=3053467 RepID=A0ABT7SDB8_9CELL|nr:ATP-grasp domain-containing protein [Cellulomonas alba]MDM7853514.1 ATP-grasp domain-containing protein [Cellulomonas alba]
MYGNDDFVPIIIGTGLNAYNIARSLHEAFGVRSLALGRVALRETADSSILDVRAYRELEQPEFVVATLKKLVDEFPGRTRVLYATIEFYTNILIDHRDELGDDFVIPLVDKAHAARLMDKTDFYRTCEQLGVPHPTTRIVPPGPVDPALGEALPFPFPVILKPSDTDTYPRLRFEGKQKVYLVQDAAELRAVAARIFAAGYAGDLVVQEYLAGDESVMRVVNTYSDRTGAMRFLSAGQVALTEWDPALVGNNNAIVTTHDPALTEAIRRFLDGVGFVGSANFDVMHDRRTGVSKLLEINLRQGATSYYTMAAGGNLARLFVDEYVYGRELPETVTTDERLWVNLPFWVLIRFVPKQLRARVRAAARRGRIHTLRYRPDLSWRRRVDIARIDLRHSLDYVRFRKVRPQG